MQLPNDSNGRSELTKKAVWLLIAVALNALELFVPRIPFLPWLKPGLANSITIIWLVKYGLNDAILYTILRTWISGFYFGFSFVTLTLSLSGGIAASLAMGLAWKLFGKKGHLGTVGIGITGAVFHNLAQLGAVYLMLTHNSSIFYQLPFMLTASLFFGGITGFIVPPLWKILDSVKINLKFPFANRLKGYGPVHIAGSLFILALCFSLLAINDLSVLLITAALFTTAASVSRRSFRILFYPLNFWPLFLFIVCVYLFFSYGTRVNGIPFLTYEGVRATTLQVLRVWIWLEAGLFLKKFRFHEIFISVLGKIYPAHTDTLLAGVLALEYFPEMIRFAKSKEGISGLNFFRAPVSSLCEFLNRVQLHIVSMTGEQLVADGKV